MAFRVGSTRDGRCKPRANTRSADEPANPIERIGDPSVQFVVGCMKEACRSRQVLVLVQGHIRSRSCAWVQNGWEGSRPRHVCRPRPLEIRRAFRASISSTLKTIRTYPLVSYATAPFAMPIGSSDVQEHVVALSTFTLAGTPPESRSPIV